MRNPKMFKSIALISAFDGLLKVLAFCLLPFYLFWMPKEQFGEFGYIFSAAGMLAPIVTLSLYVSITKDLSGTYDKTYKKDALTSVLLAVFFFVSVFIGICSILEIYFEVFSSAFNLVKNTNEKLIIVAIILLASSFNLILYSFLVTFKKPVLVLKYNGLKFFCVNIFSVFFVYVGLGLLDTSFDRLAGIALGEALCFGVTFYGCSKYFAVTIDFSYLKRALKLSLPLIPGAVAMLLSTLSDRYFLLQNFGASSVAEYNVALQFLIPMQMVMVGIQTVFGPHIFSIKKSTDAYQASVFHFVRIVFFLILINILMAACIYTAKAVGLIPEEYKDTFWLFLALSVVTVEIILLQIPFNLLVKNGKTYWVSFILIPSSALTILGGYFFVSKYGYFIGALNGGVIYGFALLVGWVVVRKALADETNEGVGVV
jgi:O-antigen/teichoic acid export membrane protein